MKIPCIEPKCPGHVYYGGEEPIDAITAYKPGSADDDDIYLECDGPERHWRKYNIPADDNGAIIVPAAPPGE